MGSDSTVVPDKLAAFLDSHVEESLRRNRIDRSEYAKYHCKRGLRNEDGTGVLVGLTEIGEVHGYIVDEGERVPIDGQLYYRGINVYDIVGGFERDRRFGFEETAYLLLFGALPNREELTEFTELLASRRDLPDGFTENMVLRAPSPDIMNKISRSVLVSYSYDENPEESTARNIVRQSIDLIARFPTFAAYGFQAKRHYYNGESLYIHPPQADLSSAENLLQMVRPDQRYTQLEAETLDLALVLHAEHGGGNNSAFTVHVVSSAGTDTYAAIAAAVGSLKGVRHGGANQKVMAMMEEIKAGVGDWTDMDEVQRYLEAIIRKERGDGIGLIYGMGHAVYTLSDPRAVLLKRKAQALAQEKGRLKELELYETVSAATPAAFAAVKGYERPIAPNVDFFSGFVYSMLNIPAELFTPIFAMSRIVGWSAHRLEEFLSEGRIIRPAYKSVVKRKAYVDLAERWSSTHHPAR